MDCPNNNSLVALAVVESFTPRFYDVVLGEFLSTSFSDAVKLSLGMLDLS
jgi:hypothetical protein